MHVERLFSPRMCCRCRCIRSCLRQHGGKTHAVTFIALSIVLFLLPLPLPSFLFFLFSSISHLSSLSSDSSIHSYSSFLLHAVRPLPLQCGTGLLRKRHTILSCLYQYGLPSPSSSHDPTYLIELFFFSVFWLTSVFRLQMCVSKQ